MIRNSCTLLVALLLFKFGSSQQLELGEVRWGKKGEVKTKLHIKEVLEFEGKTIEELHTILEKWYLDEVFTDGGGYSYRFHGVSGDFMWQSDRKKPFLVNEADWIKPKAIKCDKCMLAWKSKSIKDGQDGVYGIDLRIKEGKVLLVVADHYIFSEDSFLSDWLLSRKGLTKRPDERIEIVEQEFQNLKDNIIKYVSSYNNRPKETETEKSVDDW